jgi:hypothetical protein
MTMVAASAFRKRPRYSDQLLGSVTSATDVFGRAMEYLRTTSARTLFHQIAPQLRLGDAAIGRIEPLLGYVQHIGFLIQPESAVKLRRQASAAGFDKALVPYKSVLVARELGGLVGCPEVETAIHIFEADLGTGHTVAVETFAPSASAELIAEWIDDERAAHVAIWVPTRDALAEIEATLGEAGCELPAFMGGSAMFNPTDRALSLYYDLDGSHARVQFYCTQD